MSESVQTEKKSSQFKETWEKMKPPAVLMIICAFICALLVFAYNLTYVDTTGVLTEKLRAACVEVLGEGEYKMLTTPMPEGVTSIVADKAKKTCAVEIVADGYAKGGLHVVVGLDENGAVSGISFLSIGETPGLGTKVQNESHLKKFIGLTSPEAEVDNITGATYSSKGMKNAVALAIGTYQSQKEAIFGE